MIKHSGNKYIYALCSIKKNRQMKYFFRIILVFTILTSCNKTDKLKGFEKRISNLENQNKILVDRLNYINTEFIKPFKIYEEIVLTELENPPNQIISDYDFLIKNYPNSFWKHEAKNRIENIKRRKKYWSKKNGWKLPEKPKKLELTEIIKSSSKLLEKIEYPAPPIEIIDPTISCPGC